MNGVMPSRGLARRWLLAFVQTGVKLSLKGSRAAAPISPAKLLFYAVDASDSVAAISGAAISRAAPVAGGDAGLPRTADEVALAIIERHAALAAKLHDRRAPLLASPRALLPAAVGFCPAHRQQPGLRGIIASLVARHRPVQQDANGDDLEDKKTVSTMLQVARSVGSSRPCAC